MDNYIYIYNFNLLVTISWISTRFINPLVVFNVTKMAPRTFETSVTINQSTRNNVLEARRLQQRRWQNLKFCIFNGVLLYFAYKRVWHREEWLKIWTLLRNWGFHNQVDKYSRSLRYDAVWIATYFWSELFSVYILRVVLFECKFRSLKCLLE